MTEEKVEALEKKCFESALFNSGLTEEEGNIIISKIYALFKNQGLSQVRLANDASYQKYNENRLLFEGLVSENEYKNENGKYKKRLNETEYSFLLNYAGFGRFLMAKDKAAEKSFIGVHPKSTAAYGLLCRTMVGQEKMKNTLCRLGSVYQYVKKRHELGMYTQQIHKVLAFIGPPGTGKTTAARYFAKMMEEGGVLCGEKTAYVTGSQLKAGYIGQTADKVHKIFENNDIIIIDEAYSLVNHNYGEKTDSFAQEALAQLCIEVEEHSQDKMIIFAGYGASANEKYNKMERFMEENPGISSRITFKVHFEPYTISEMLSIFEVLAERNSFRLEKGWQDILRPLFEERIPADNFGNGREARRLLEIAMTYSADKYIDWEYGPDAGESEKRRRISLMSCEDIKNAVNEIYGKSKKY